MDIGLIVVRSDELPAAQQAGLDALLGSVFAGQDHGLHWASGDWNVLLYVNDVLVSNVEVLTRVVTVNQEPLRIGGVGGVATWPEYRGRGYASQAMQRAAAFMRDDLALDFALLVCAHERVSLYESLGWQVVAGPMFFDQPGGKQQFDEVVMILSLNGKPWPPGKIDLMGLPW